MSREVEVKARANLEQVKTRLKELGARLVKVEDQVDTYFEHPCKSLMASDEALRLRVSSSGVELTYKGPREAGGAKSRVEVTLRVHDPCATKLLLESLGFREVVVVRKKREVYVVGDFEVALDSVEGLGEFVEVESKGASGERLQSILQLLGVGEVVQETYAELVAKLLPGAGRP
ncbi:MAG: class IV adenylate cyclase [Thermofilaceae archaeon]|nr:class IV adenylate cyclase [Thermofilaceae archaeon]MCX8181364.1 class IV adenylate cyclase [Thermofilaceae archaeon]